MSNDVKIVDGERGYEFENDKHPGTCEKKSECPWTPANAKKRDTAGIACLGCGYIGAVIGGSLVRCIHFARFHKIGLSRNQKHIGILFTRIPRHKFDPKDAFVPFLMNNNMSNLIATLVFFLRLLKKDELPWLETQEEFDVIDGAIVKLGVSK